MNSVSHYVCHTMHVTLCMSHYLCHTMYVTPCMSHYLCHTMHVTPCMSHYLCHTMHVTPCMSHYLYHTSLYDTYYRLIRSELVAITHRLYNRLGFVNKYNLLQYIMDLYLVLIQETTSKSSFLFTQLQHYATQTPQIEVLAFILATYDIT